MINSRRIGCAGHVVRMARLYNRPEVAAVPGDVIPTPLKKKGWLEEEFI
jgi:hypothetical protein